MKTLLLLIICFLSLSLAAQKISFNQKLKVGINKGANEKFQVKFVDAEKDVQEKKEAETYNSSGNLISYQKKTVPDWTKSKILDSTQTAPYDELKDKGFLYADIKPDEGRLLVYFWPYWFSQDDSAKTGSTKQTVDQFFKKNLFSIELPDRVNLSFRSSAFHAGVLSLPVKVYTGAPDSVSAVQAAVSAGVYIGKRWGKTKFVKLPNEKEYTTYQTSSSINLVAGVNKLDLDEKNTKDGGKKFKGSTTTLSLGLAAGWHYKTFSIFLASGFDTPLGSKAENWYFKGKPWVGFGAGFDIF